MFTGIIQAVGEVIAMERRSGDLRITIQAPELDWTDVELGDSIAANGVCLTAVELPTHCYVADVSVETMNLTTVKNWQVGTRINLEKALTPSSRLGGHLVSGHVDGIGEVVSRNADARSERFSIRAPKALAKYIAHKGSITVDGTSLTVNAIKGDVFELNIVPHTLQWTTLDGFRAGTLINLEVDVIARYLERLLLGDRAADPDATELHSGNLTQAFLRENGY